MIFANLGFAADARVVIPYQFDEARPFSNSVAAAKQDGLWGYIDRFGEWKIKPRFAIPDVGDFSFGFAFVRDGFITSADTVAFDGKKFQNGRTFHAAANGGKNPMSAVKVGGFWGYIGVDGNFQIEPKYDDAGDFSPLGIAPVKSGGVWGYIDAKGREVVNLRFDYAWNFSGGFAAVMLDGKVGYIGRDGQFAIKPSFEQAGEFKNGRAAVFSYAQGKKFGFVNDKGQIIISADFNGAGAFNDGLAPVATNARWGYIDVSGKIVLAPMYDKAQPFSEGLAAVEQDGLWGYIEAKRF